MGNLCCCRKKTKKKIVLLLVGLDNAGKTVAAKGLAGEAIDSVVPTVGFSVINLAYLDYVVKVFDLGGGPTIRGIWHKYFVDAHGVIFVVDASDIRRLEEAKNVLRTLLSNEKIARKPVLVLANKQDNENALDEVDLIEKLELETIVNGNECPTLVESCSATEVSKSSAKLDPGIKKGYEWLLNYIIRNYEILNKRVEEDVLQQITTDNYLRMEKIKALKEAAQNTNNDDDDAIESYSNYERKMNGEINERPPVEPIVCFESLQIDTDSSGNSSDSFPPVYHIKENILLERPKSAIQIVRQQLEFNAPNKKLTFVSKASNKTAPLHFYGSQVPRSASTQRKSFNNSDRRNLKSAGDARVTTIDLPNVPISTSDDFHKEIYELMHKAGREGNSNITKNGLTKFNNGDLNSISVVNVEV